MTVFNEINAKMKEYKFFQSRSFTLKNHKKVGGTEKDGTISKKFQEVFPLNNC